MLVPATLKAPSVVAVDSSDAAFAARVVVLVPMFAVLMDAIENFIAELPLLPPTL